MHNPNKIHLQSNSTATVSHNIHLILRFTSPPKRNQSLYDELSAATSYPTFSSPFSSSSAEQVSSEPNDEENKSTEFYTLSSIESTLATEEDEDFKNNATKEERHRLDEIKIDEESIVYSSTIDFTTSTPASTPKKGKYLDLMPPGEDNMNASLPNAAEVWALAGMRDMDSVRKPTTETIEKTDVEVLSNNTIKSLLDWSEIARYDNTTELIPQTTKSNDLTEATAEHKEVTVSSPFPSITSKSIIEDNRLELEHENAEFTAPANKSVIDDETINKDRDETSVELIAPISEKKFENLEESTTVEPITTTEEAMTTIEMTTSIVDSITSDSDENSEVFKRTITELPEDQFVSTSTYAPPRTTATYDEISTTTTSPPATEHLTTNLNARSTMVTKSISIRIATSTAEPSTSAETTIQSDEVTTTPVDILESSSFATIEIMDDDKFKYSTLLPEGTAADTTTHVSPTVHRPNDSTRSISEGVASTAGEGDGRNNVAVISITVCVIAFILLAAGGFVS